MPLTLKFVAAIVKEEGSVPETRAELYECAVAGLSREANPNLSNSTSANLSENDVLNTAGQAMATMLITGRDGIAKGWSDESMLLLSDISGPENFYLRNLYLEDLSEALSVTNGSDDARIHLSEVVARGDPVERNRWMALVDLFRGKDHLIPKDIQEIARPFAEGDRDLIDSLTKKPKSPKRSEEEEKWRQQIQHDKRSEQENTKQTRAAHTEHLDEVRRGEFKWIFNPACACLGLFSDLQKGDEPSGRIADWLGDDIRDAVLTGFEAVLHSFDTVEPGMAGKFS